MHMVTPLWVLIQLPMLHDRAFLWARLVLAPK